MRFILILFVLCSFGATAQSQSSGNVWLETGVSGKVIKNLDWSTSVTSRFGPNGLETIFPQVGFKYKVTKWFRPSIEYRFISNKQQAGYYTNSHRINLNAEFRASVDRFSFKSRIRYQFGFKNLGSAAYYDSDFDQAVRLKVEAMYDIDNFLLSPVISAELFYDPMYGPFGQKFNKLRAYAGVDFDLTGPHSIAVGYLYDTRIQLAEPRIRHILNLSYSYQIGGNKSKDEVKKK